MTASASALRGVGLSRKVLASAAAGGKAQPASLNQNMVMATEIGRTIALLQASFSNATVAAAGTKVAQKTVANLGGASP